MIHILSERGGGLDDNVRNTGVCIVLLKREVP